MKTAIRVLGLVCIVLVSSQCATSGPNPNSDKSNVTENRMGYVMPRYNFSIDGEYSAQTARLIPGYTAVTVAIANKGFRPMVFWPDKDNWRIKDRAGKWHRAVNEIEFEEPEHWAALNENTRTLAAYPTQIPPGYTKTFELFFRGEKNLAGFRTIEFYSTMWEKKFTFTRY